MVKSSFAFRNGAVISLSSLQLVGFFEPQGLVKIGFHGSSQLFTIECHPDDCKALQDEFRKFLDARMTVLAP